MIDDQPVFCFGSFDEKGSGLGIPPGCELLSLLIKSMGINRGLHNGVSILDVEYGRMGS